MKRLLERSIRGGGMEPKKLLKERSISESEVRKPREGGMGPECRQWVRLREVIWKWVSH